MLKISKSGCQIYTSTSSLQELLTELTIGLTKFQTFWLHTPCPCAVVLYINQFVWPLYPNLSIILYKLFQYWPKILETWLMQLHLQYTDWTTRIRTRGFVQLIWYLPELCMSPCRQNQSVNFQGWTIFHTPGNPLVSDPPPGQFILSPSVWHLWLATYIKPATKCMCQTNTCGNLMTSIFDAISP